MDDWTELAALPHKNTGKREISGATCTLGLAHTEDTNGNTNFSDVDKFTY
jgi:hypothetical protein